jgi:hypothetical protein
MRPFPLSWGWVFLIAFALFLLGYYVGLQR